MPQESDQCEAENCENETVNRFCSEKCAEAGVERVASQKRTPPAEGRERQGEKHFNSLSDTK